MGYPFATAALGPLFAQGATCRVTPRPPRPPAHATAWRATARAARAGGRRFGRRGRRRRDAARRAVGQLASALAATHRVSWKLLARTGLTTQELVDWLAAEPAEPFDVAVTSLGVNDGRRAAGPLAQQAGSSGCSPRASGSGTRSRRRCRQWSAFRRCRSRSRGISGCARSGSTRHSPGGRHAAALHVPARGAAARAPPMATDGFHPAQPPRGGPRRSPPPCCGGQPYDAGRRPRQPFIARA